MAERYSVQMMKFYPLSRQSTINEQLGLGIGLDEYFTFLVMDGAVSWHYTQSIKLNLILLSIFRTNSGLTFLDVVDKHA